MKATGEKFHRNARIDLTSRDNDPAVARTSSWLGVVARLTKGDSSRTTDFVLPIASKITSSSIIVCHAEW